MNCSVALQELACTFGSVSFPGLGTKLTIACTTVSNGELCGWGLGMSLCVTIGCSAEKGFSGS